jgi:hypothetical protein
MEATPVVPVPAPAPKKKTGAVIGTVVAALLCGCPGLVAMCWGLISAIVSFMPNANIDIGGSSDPNTAFFVGLGSLCGGIIFIAIPIVVGILTLKEKKPKKGELPPVEPPPSEPLPPAA